jgi:hypothetical protein
MFSAATGRLPPCERPIPENPAACDRLCQAAKTADRVLTDDECHAPVTPAGARAGVRERSW